MLDLERRGGWLFTTIAGLELLLDQPEALALASEYGGIEAWLEVRLPTVLDRMRGEALWASTSQQALREEVKVLAVQLERATQRRSLHLRWRDRVDVKAEFDPSGELCALSGCFDLARRYPSFEHRFLGRFEDRQTHYEGQAEEFQLRLDLPEATQLLEPLGSFGTWEQSLHAEVSRVLMSKANRAWLGLSREDVDAQLRLTTVQASSCDDCLHLHYAWPFGTATVRCRSGSAARIDKPSIVVFPRMVELPPLGAATVHEEDGKLSYRATVHGIELHFGDAALVHEAYALANEVAEETASFAAQAARSLFDTWVSRWRKPSHEPATVEGLQSKLTLRRIEVDEDCQTFCFDDGGAFLGHEVHCERRDGQWQEAFLFG